MLRDKTRLSLRLRPHVNLPAGETMWAEHVGPGRYRLLNMSFFAPLCVGDIVTVAPRPPSSVLSITGIAEAAPTAMSIIGFAPQIAPEVKRVADGWLALGAVWSEGTPGLLTTVWDADLHADDVYDLLVREIGHRHGWHPPSVYAPEDRLVRRDDGLADFG